MVVDAPFVSRSERAGLGGNHPFRLDENSQSILYLTNITGKSTKALIVIFHEGGLYTPELIAVAAGETKAIDLLEIRNGQIKDVQERTLPPNLTKGQLFWHPHEGEALIGRVVTVDKASGTASNFSCQSCCGQEPSRFDVTPIPLIGPPGNSTQMNVMEWDTLCGQMTLGPYNVTNSCHYISNNTSVATVNATGLVGYAGVGATAITMTMDYFRSDAISAEDCGMFPATFTQDCPVQTVEVAIESFLGVGKDQSVNVPITLTPSPTMSSVTLTLRATTGTGSAKFASNNSTTLNINQTTSVAIKGITESSTADNIILEAKVNGSVVESETFSVVLVTLSLRTSGSVSTDNAARGEYMARIISSASLGTLFSTGTNAHEWRTNVEIIGTVKPSNYAGSVMLEREIVERRIYDNMTLFIDGVVTNQADNSLQEFLDDNPQSGGSSGKVYDLDGPSIASTSSTPLNAIRRRRTNFRQWATIDGVQSSDPRVRASADFLWFQRLSIIKTASGDQLQSGVSGDNVAGAGTTKLTWNLQ